MIQGWLKCDTIGQRKEDIAGILRDIFGDVEAETWRSYADGLPAGMTLEELRDYLWADTDEQQSALHEAVLTRLSLSIPAEGVLSPRVRIMTMHGAKGLSGKIVFIPGLEEAILPGPKRSPYPGLVLEAARLLYMSITRAKAACIISYASSRVVYGKFETHTPSDFVTYLNGRFSFREDGLSAAEIRFIMEEVSGL